MKTFISAFLLIISFQAQAFTDVELEAEFAKLTVQAGPYIEQADSGKAVLSIQDDEMLFTGKDANRFLYLNNGVDAFNVDSLIFTEDYIQKLYTSADIGYLKSDDWNEFIDADKILQTVSLATEESNKVREAGYSHLHVDGWAEKPTLDKQNSVAYWAMYLVNDSGERTVNARAIKLNASGMTVVQWIGSPEQFTSAKAALLPAVKAMKYNLGQRYADFDPAVHAVAAVGIGALTYKMITGKSGKGVAAGLAAAIAIFLKKLGFLLLLPFIFVWRGIKRLFTRKSK